MDFKALATGIYLEALCVDGDAVWVGDPVGGGICRLWPDGRVEQFLPDKRWHGCIVLNEGGCILISGPGGISWFNPATGATGMLIDAVDGKPLLGANEMLPLSSGGLIFGSLDAPAVANGTPPGPTALYRLDPDGRATQLCDNTIKFSNGIGISPDGRRVYNNDTFAGTYAYDVLPDGRLAPGKMLLEKLDADGLAMDVKNRLWLTGYRSNEIICLNPDGTIDERIPVPAGGVTNIRFGGADARDLYLTTVTADAGDRIAKGDMPSTPTSTLYRTRTTVAGKITGRTRFRLR